jgi:hypothetical protein
MAIAFGPRMPLLMVSFVFCTPLVYSAYAARAAAIAGPVIRHPQIARQIEGDPTRVLILQVMSRR